MMKSQELYNMRLIPMNLEFFNNSGGEKTEKATPKKREKAREEGQVAQSQEIGTAFLLIVAFVALRIFAPMMMRNLMGVMHMNFTALDQAVEFASVEFMSTYIWSMFGQVILIMLPLGVTVMAVGIFINVVQVGWKPTGKPLKPKLANLSPKKGIKKIFSLKIFLELFKAVGKFAIILLVVYNLVWNERDMLLILGDMELAAAAAYVGGLFLNIGLMVGIVYIFIAAVDYTFNRRKHEKQLRMSKHEVKEEYKQMEGDPLIKSKIRQRMREASMRRMMGDVPTADVVITNPTHYAIALKYDRERGEAPFVLAKGADHLAQRIKEIAKDAEIIIVEDKPLARTLYATVEVGQEIPPQLYQAVAEVLAYVYKLKNAVTA